jgi:hypothetical protein
VWFKPDLLVWKEYEKDLQLLGLVKIVKGRYGMGDELFLLQPGDIDFYGHPLYMDYSLFPHTLARFEKDLSPTPNPLPKRDQDHRRFLPQK